MCLRLRSIAAATLAWSEKQGGLAASPTREAKEASTERMHGWVGPVKPTQNFTEGAVFIFIWLVFVAACVALFTSPFWSPFWTWGKPKEEEPEPKRLFDEVQEAAFEVILASLQEEPEKWRLITHNEETVFWLRNDEAGVAIWVANGADNLKMVRREHYKPENRKPSDFINPSDKWRVRLYEACAAIMKGKAEEAELGKLEKMVAGFAVAMENRRAEHDPQSA